MPNESDRLDAAVLAVKRATRVCRTVQGGKDDVRSITKDDRSPVTVADFASQAVVAHTLLQSLGTVTMVAEEASDELRSRLESGDNALPEAVLNAVQAVWPEATMDAMLGAIDLGGSDPVRDALHGFWTLDPIDGTKGFLRGQQYAVSLAWIEGGTPIIGTLACPNLSRDFSRGFDDPDPDGTVYMAVAGDGLAESSAVEGEDERTMIKRLEHPDDEPVRACESVESAHSKHDDTQKILDHLGGAGEPARLDSQCKYAVVARGQADAYLRLPTKKDYVERIWDHAAGSLIAIEADCAVSDIHGRSLDFGHGRGLEQNKGIVVAPAKLHGRIIGAIEELGISA